MNLKENKKMEVNVLIFDIVKQYVSYDQETMTINSSKELGLDSLQCIRMIVDLEKKFDIEIEDEGLLLENFKSVDTIVKLVNSILDKKA
ncbi:acyl carrier protein [Paenibacillus pabuli]|uniref:Acyl carrier protein n=1 Tax=Paenibacillus pabuli TaxID=1472 RepID=A0ABX9BET6_9BACL|nr:phosphopantetheine-binding protein [Paenibacillus pabuli]RAI89564.1 acyl carrier protein [Paenibacillus pabuli]